MIFFHERWLRERFPYSVARDVNRDLGLCNQIVFHGLRVCMNRVAAYSNMRAKVRFRAAAARRACDSLPQSLEAGFGPPREARRLWAHSVAGTE